jgi:hypothetical protein
MTTWTPHCVQRSRLLPSDTLITPLVTATSQIDRMSGTRSTCQPYRLEFLRCRGFVWVGHIVPNESELEIVSERGIDYPESELDGTHLSPSNRGSIAGLPRLSDWKLKPKGRSTCDGGVIDPSSAVAAAWINSGNRAHSFPSIVRPVQIGACSTAIRSTERDHLW